MIRKDASIFLLSLWMMTDLESGSGLRIQTMGHFSMGQYLALGLKRPLSAIPSYDLYQTPHCPGIVSTRWLLTVSHSSPGRQDEPLSKCIGDQIETGLTGSRESRSDH
jgi:hypothetical protein